MIGSKLVILDVDCCHRCFLCHRVHLPGIGWIFCEIILGLVENDEVCDECLIRTFNRQFQSLSAREIGYDQGGCPTVPKVR